LLAGATHLQGADAHPLRQFARSGRPPWLARLRHRATVPDPRSGRLHLLKSTPSLTRLRLEDVLA
jgi:hypothetical protein